jgi:hypothetical protein
LGSWRTTCSRSATAAGLRILLVLEIQVAELFVVADGGVVDDCGLQLLDVAAPREDLEARAQQRRVRDDFDQDVGGGAEAAADQDDP